MVSALIFVCVALAAGLPAKDAQMIEPGSDTAVVESTIREVRAAPSRTEKKGILFTLYYDT